MPRDGEHKPSNCLARLTLCALASFPTSTSTPAARPPMLRASCPSGSAGLPPHARGRTASGGPPNGTPRAPACPSPKLRNDAFSSNRALIADREQLRDLAYDALVRAPQSKSQDRPSRARDSCSTPKHVILPAFQNIRSGNADASVASAFKHLSI
ncbi:hypothetical protein NUW54_g6188 [Trametes sanguinea]|uniref:Uncharacterized protein n=1 Tax=Trametes sanguinea TaxID=158606 RepID=A0ACC1PT17_9APHY|nr:hypothetical protein NUW54_g6188 [Trametes sanguinea]